ncbi:MAG: NPCBM/NEW2 domain-containing protein, partial [Planctomycetota bacterium]
GTDPTHFGDRRFRVGPRYDFVPNEQLLLLAGNKLFESGIYAHAPAAHRYRLSGKWKRFRGRVGLASGHPGSVVFVVSLDGTELWRSELIQEGRLLAVDVDVSGGSELQLTVENGGDGNGADWGVWLDPSLHR